MKTLNEIHAKMKRPGKKFPISRQALYTRLKKLSIKPGRDGDKKGAILNNGQARRLLKDFLRVNP